MDRATSNSGLRTSVLLRLASLSLAGLAVAVTFGLPLPCNALDFREQARESFVKAEQEYQSQSTNTTAAWQFARACFDLAEFATNSTERAKLAERGIEACRKVIAIEPGSVHAHYYLGMNLGQLARTRGIGALKLVSQMEREFLRVAELDKTYDYAGPHRNLGLLYRDAPAIASVGSRSKARHHLQRATEIAPGYPGNHLNLIDSYLKWGDRNGATRELKVLESKLPEAKAKLAGTHWASSWVEWMQRLEALRVKIGDEPARLKTPHAR